MVMTVSRKKYRAELLGIFLKTVRWGLGFAVAATAAEPFALTAAHPPPSAFVIVIFFRVLRFCSLRFHEGYPLICLRLRDDALRHERLQFSFRLLYAHGLH